MKILNLSFLTLILFIFQSAYSQNTIGFKAGYTNAWESYGEIETPDGAEIDIDTYNFSFFYFKSLSNQISLGVEPGFVKRGAACVPGFISPWVGDTRIQISYVDVPLNCQVKFPLIKEQLSLFTKAGFGFSFAAAAKEELVDIDSGEVLNSRKIPMGIFSEVNRWNIGANAGAGLYMKAGPGNILLEANYYNSFSHALSTEFSLNRNINYNLGYSFNL